VPVTARSRFGRGILWAARSPRTIAVAIAALTTSGMLLMSACGSSPTEPTGCAGGQLNTERCDTGYTVHDLPTLTDSPPCPTRAEIESVSRDIPVTVRYDVTAGAFECREEDGSLDLTWTQKRTYQALLYLRGLRFDAPLPWTDKTVYDWLRVTIPNGIVIDSTGNSNSCLRCAGPINIVLLTASQRVQDQSASVSDTPYTVIVHEARHAEGWRHTCDNGTHDRSVAEMGASGVGYWLLRWIAVHSEEPALVREKAAGSAKLVLQNSFCCECQGSSASILGGWPILFLASDSEAGIGARRCSVGSSQHH
jgi:hypothetical protein